MVGLDDYVRGVVAAEMPSAWSMQALEAQAIAARTYAITATITDPQSGESRSTESVTFYVRQPSELSPQHQKP